MLHVYGFNTNCYFCFGFVQVCAERLGHNAEQWTNENALGWAKTGFPEPGVSVLEGNILMH